MNVLFFLFSLLIYVASIASIGRAVQALGNKKSVAVYRIKYIDRTLKILFTISFVIIISLLLGIDYAQLTIFLSSVFAVVGVAFFAQWSILSNITGSLIIFFAFPYRVGDLIRVVDKDDQIIGVISEITLFHVIIKRNDDLITYPNNLILQKPVIKLDSNKTSIEKEISSALVAKS